MSLAQLQARIRARKTPLALTLSPDPARLSPKILKNFTDMFGDVPMARAEALRYHGTTMLDAAAGLLPAVVLRADAYLSQGMMGADVLANLITAAHAKELADLAVQLDKAGDHTAYEQVMAAVSDFEKGNMRLSVVLTSLEVKGTSE